MRGGSRVTEPKARRARGTARGELEGLHSCSTVGLRRWRLGRLRSGCERLAGASRDGQYRVHGANEHRLLRVRCASPLRALCGEKLRKRLWRMPLCIEDWPLGWPSWRAVEAT